MDLDVVAERLEPIDFGDSDEIDSLLGSDRDPALSLSLRADRFQQGQKTRLDSGAAVGLPQSSQRMFHRPGEPRPGERFEQVVDRVHLEGAQCECVISGHENDRGRGGGIELFQYGKAIHFRHLDVEEYERRPEIADHLQRFIAVASLADDDRLGKSGEQSPDAFARQRLIVGDQHSHRVHRALSDFPPFRGTVTITSAPEPWRPFNARRPADPYNCSSRSLVFDNPMPSATEGDSSPAPSSATVICTESSTPRARIAIVPAPARREIP